MGDTLMRLMTSKIKKQIPNLGGQEGKGMDAIVHVKWFNPTGGQTWWITEYDPKQEMVFGYATGGYEVGWGRMSLPETQHVRVRFGLGIERDLHFTPKPLRECLKDT